LECHGKTDLTPDPSPQTERGVAVATVWVLSEQYRGIKPDGIGVSSGNADLTPDPSPQTERGVAVATVWVLSEQYRGIKPDVKCFSTIKKRTS
jgi:hypothetical protein